MKAVLNRWSLSLSLPLLVLIFLLVSSAVIYSFTTRHIEHSIREQMVNQVDEHLSTLQGLFSSMLRRGDQDGLKAMIASISASSSVELLALVNEQQRVIAASRLDLVGQSLQALTSPQERPNQRSIAMTEENGIYKVDAAIPLCWQGNNGCGSIFLREDVTEHYQLEIATYRYFSLAHIIGMVLSCLLLGMLVQRMLSARAKQLVAYVQYYESSTESLGPLLGGYDELAQVDQVMAETFSRMRQQNLELEHRTRQLNDIVDSSYLAYWDWDLVKDQCTLSRHWAELLGLGASKLKLTSAEWLELIHPDDQGSFLDWLENWQRDGVTCKLEHSDGHWLSLLIVGSVLETGELGKPLRACGICRDISPRVHALKSSNMRRDVLEQLTARKPLKVVLASLVGHIQDRSPEMIASILVLDEKKQKLMHGAAPSLPAFYSQAVDGINIGDGVGSCGTAAYTGIPVTVHDIAQHPYWKDFKGLAKQAGLKACWSLPLLHDGKILGTLAIYFRHTTEDSAVYRDLMNSWAELAATAVHYHLEMSWVDLTSQIFDTSSEAMVVTDANNVIQAVNKAFSLITGYSREEAIGNSPSMLSSGFHEPGFYQEMWQTLMSTERWRGEIINRKKDGTLYPELLSISTVRDPGGTGDHYVATFSDITFIKETEQQIKDLTFYDPLTGLPNRKMLESELEGSVQLAKRTQSQLAVLFIGLNRFKPVNDALGYECGDEVLKQAADRLKYCLRPTDFVARLGGDEFCVILEELQDTEQAAKLANQVIEHLCAIYHIAGHHISLGASVGISVYPDDAEEVVLLLKHADSAVAKAKHSAGHSYEFYTSDMTDAAIEKVALDTSLRAVLQNQQLQVLYQPQLDMQTGIMTGAEALVRWNHPEKGVVSPMSFIPMAEENGMIIPIGEWVLEQSCQQIVAWKTAGLPLQRVSVNLSSVQIQQFDLVEQVKAILMRTDCPPEWLELEVTETVIMNEAERCIETLQQLQSMGIKISVDDFGTGYSSLSYLKHLPINKLKIDRTFIQYLPDDGDDVAITTTIISLAENLSLEVIAEGVETRENQDCLLKLGCYSAQGYLYSKPVPAEEIVALAAQDAAVTG